MPALDLGEVPVETDGNNRFKGNPRQVIWGGADRTPPPHPTGSSAQPRGDRSPRGFRGGAAPPAGDTRPAPRPSPRPRLQERGGGEKKNPQS